MNGPRQTLPISLLALCPVLVLACPRGPGAQEATPAPRGRLVFSRAMAGTYLAAGGEYTRISYAHGDYIRPRFLPGQDRVLLNSKRGGGPGIWVQSITSEERETICDGDQVSVAPDGRSIVLRREGAIVHRDLASGTETVLSPAKWGACSHPSFCPDGRVLFVSTDQGKDSVCLVDPAGPGVPKTLFDAEIKSAPRCSPDGKTLAYQNGTHIYLFDIPTGRHRRLTLAAGVQSWPMWSQDGKSLGYLQSPGLAYGPWHIFRVELDDPEHVSLVMRDVEVGPDWNGLGFSEGAASELKGNAVRLWCSDEPVQLHPEAQELPEPTGGWKRLPESGGGTTGDLLVECEWGGVYLSAAAGKVFLAQRQGDGLTQTAVVCLFDGKERLARRIESIKVSPPGPDEAPMQATWVGEDGTRIGSALAVSRTRPVLEVKPGARVGGALIRRPLALAIVPDRLSNDLIYEAGGYDSPVVPLPGSPFVLGMPRSESGLLMVVTPSAEQTVQLVRDQGQNAFGEIRARCNAESVFVSFLPGDDLWRRTRVEPAEEGDGWHVAWANPFPAQWRLALQGSHTNLSLMNREDTPTREKSVPLPHGRSLTGAAELAIIYAYGRSQNTPLDRAMPMDVLWDALGIERAWALLDIDGVRTYRHADEPVPYKDPRVALKAISWTRARERPGAQKKIDDLCRDIVLSLRGLDSRMQEYESFAGEVARVCEGDAEPELPETLREWLSQQLVGLDETLRRRPARPIRETTEQIEAFRKDTGAAYSPFSSSITGALFPRLAHLAAHRAFAKGVRDRAGLALARPSESRQACEQLRALAGDVLRKRYYLEEDWRGEEPLGEPEVSYEKITDL